MEENELVLITHTLDGFDVKGLRWNLTDNVITGLVRCPILGKPHINDGFIGCAWRRNGKTTNKHKGRNDLDLKINQ